MNFYYLTVFPEIFDSFLATSLVRKAIVSWAIGCTCVNIRDYSTSNHSSIDDEIYWGWSWLLLQAQPIIDAIQASITRIEAKNTQSTYKIVMLSPSKTLFDQQKAHSYIDGWVTDIVFICWRYEWIDHRVELRCRDTYWNSVFEKISIGEFVTLWWEVPSMLVTETISRLIPWVIKEESSRQCESYRPEKWWKNIEYPQYTRPQEVYWYTVPDVLLSWHHQHIEQWKDSNSN